MDSKNVFYFKNIVDSYYPTEEETVVTQEVVNAIREDIKKTG